MRAGFTLLELSIVLVIIGLIVGGVMAGQELVKQSEIRSYVQQKESYEAALSTYRLKYNALPGDHANAFAYYGGKTGCAVNQLVTGSDSSGCNGNGNLDHSNGEHFKSWVHLASSGVIPGEFSGSYSNASDYQNGINLPTTKRGTYFLLYHYTLTFRQYASGPYFSANRLRLYVPPTSGFLATEIRGIDEKYDDGRAGLGFITVHSNTCADQGVGGNTAAAQYDLSDPAKRCAIDWAVSKR